MPLIPGVPFWQGERSFGWAVSNVLVVGNQLRYGKINGFLEGFA
jgi:hypothetical protein